MAANRSLFLNGSVLGLAGVGLPHRRHHGAGVVDHRRFGVHLHLGLPRFRVQVGFAQSALQQSNFHQLEQPALAALVELDGSPVGVDDVGSGRLVSAGVICFGLGRHAEKDWTTTKVSRKCSSDGLCPWSGTNPPQHGREKTRPDSNWWYLSPACQGGKVHPAAPAAEAPVKDAATPAMQAPSFFPI